MSRSAEAVTADAQRNSNDSRPGDPIWPKYRVFGDGGGLWRREEAPSSGLRVAMQSDRPAPSTARLAALIDLGVINELWPGEIGPDVVARVGAR